MWFLLRRTSPATALAALCAILTLVAPGRAQAQTASVSSSATPTSLQRPAGLYGFAPSVTPTPTRGPTVVLPSLTPVRTPTAAAPTATFRAPATATATPAPSATARPAASPTASPSPTEPPPFVITGQPLAGQTIVLDPGHGGRDPGALYNGVREADFNLATALTTRPLLLDAGARVILTRETDTLVGPADGTITQDLEARAQIANRANADLFISIHANVHTDPEVAGAITFYGQESGYAGGQQRSPRQVELSRQLAGAIEHGVALRTGENERGIRIANFWVLGATKMPSVLLEAGFLTNPQEAQRLASPSYQRRIAEGITLGVIDFVRRRVVLPTDRAKPMGGPDARYYDQTGHNLAFGFRNYFDTHGGLDAFGYPRTEEMVENGFTVQYFQRARFEYHPELAGTPYEVELGLLGDAITADRRPFPLGTPFESSAEHRWYPETGHGLHFAFLRYFDTHGGLDAFGYPISEELYGENGWPYAVQYFQRARFEYHPEYAGTPYEVELGLVGDELLAQRGWLG